MQNKIIQGITQPDLAHSLPLLNYNQQKIKRVPQFEQNLHHGLIKQKMSALLLHKNKRLQQKFPKHQIYDNRSGSITTQQIKIGQGKPNKIFKKLKAAKNGPKNNQLKHFNQASKQSDEFEDPNSSDQFRLHKILNFNHVNSSKGRNIQKMKKSVLFNKNQGSLLKRYNTDADTYILNKQQSRKHSIGNNSFLERSELTSKESSIEKKSIIINKNLLKSYLIKVNDQPINKQIWNLLTADHKNISGAIERRSSQQLLIRYFEGLPSLLQQLSTCFIRFFQINVTQQINHKEYCSFLKRVKNYNDRSWQILGFLFWDCHHDGFIDQSDIFIHFSHLNDFDCENQRSMSQLQLDKQHELPRINQENYKLLHLLFQINSYLVSSQKKTISTVKPQNHEIEYLEEALLDCQSTPTYSIAVSLIKASHNTSIKNKSFRKNSSMLEVKQGNLELFSKNANQQKKLSAYQQCHIAVQHNEDTRMIRELVDHSRMKIEAKYKKINEQLIKDPSNMYKLGKKMNYCEYISLEFGPKIKNIILSVLGVIGEY